MDRLKRDEKAFPKLDEEDLRQLEPLSKRETYAAGETILAHGQADTDLIVVVSGTIDIINCVDNDRLITTHSENDFVGDVDLLTRRPIIICAKAGQGGPTTVLRVPGAKLRYVLNVVPRLSEKLIVAFQARRDALAKAGVVGIKVAGPAGCGHTNLIREFLHKNFVPFTWYDPDTDVGRAETERMGNGRPPSVDCGDGQFMHAPTLHDVANAAGVWRGCPTGAVDLAIVGGGPAGIAAAVYAASEGLRTVVLDKLGPGGQAGGSSRIENFIGFPAGLSGTDLATRGVLQMLKFGATMVAPVVVDTLEAGVDGACHKLHLDCGATIEARCVLGTTGVAWRRLEADGARRFERAGVYYACTAVEALLHDTHDVAVVGGGNSAGQAVMYLAEQCLDRKVHLLVRRPLGSGMSDYLVERIRKAANVTVHEGVEVSAVRGETHIETLELTDCKTKEKSSLDCRAVFVFIGAEPHADWLPADVARDERGYVLTGSDVVRAGKWPLKDRDPCPLETSLPGVLAGGDVRAGSTKRVGFAVGDGSLAVTCVHKLLAERA